jgi:hypothetical protein
MAQRLVAPITRCVAGLHPARNLDAEKGEFCAVEKSTIESRATRLFSNPLG